MLLHRYRTSHQCSLFQNVSVGTHYDPADYLVKPFLHPHRNMDFLPRVALVGKMYPLKCKAVENGLGISPVLRRWTRLTIADKSRRKPLVYIVCTEYMQCILEAGQQAQHTVALHRNTMRSLEMGDFMGTMARKEPALVEDSSGSTEDSDSGMHKVLPGLIACSWSTWYIEPTPRNSEL